jgi:hypothetical protein
MMGGIYGRPIAIGNFGHFIIAALALLKSIIAGRHGAEIAIGAAVYAAFACLFAIVVFGRSPTSAAK